MDGDPSSWARPVVTSAMIGGLSLGLVGALVGQNRRAAAVAGAAGAVGVPAYTATYADDPWGFLSVVPAAMVPLGTAAGSALLYALASAVAPERKQAAAAVGALAGAAGMVYWIWGDER